MNEPESDPRHSGLHEAGGIVLEDHQVELLRSLVEAHRQVMPRQDFIAFHVANADPRAFVRHAGLAEVLRAADGDLDVLARHGLLLMRPASRGTLLFAVGPRALEYYTALQRQGQPTEHVERAVRRYIEGDDFKGRYPAAYAKWAKAEELLWGEAPQSQLTAIGHHCREAAQDFATALVSQYQPPDCPADPASTVARVRAVLSARRPSLPSTVHPLLDALLAYWGAVMDLHQRQEHGAQREGQPLTWEDGRRVVFQTLLVMVEIDRTVSARSQ